MIFIGVNNQLLPKRVDRIVKAKATKLARCSSSTPPATIIVQMSLSGPDILANT